MEVWEYVLWKYGSMYYGSMGYALWKYRGMHYGNMGMWGYALWEYECTFNLPPFCRLFIKIFKTVSHCTENFNDETADMSTCSPRRLCPTVNLTAMLVTFLRKRVLLH